MDAVIFMEYDGVILRSESRIKYHSFNFCREGCYLFSYDKSPTGKCLIEGTRERRVCTRLDIVWRRVDE